MEKNSKKRFFEEWAADYDQHRDKSFLEKSKRRMQELFNKHLMETV